MAGWSDGYVTEVQYTGKFFPHMAPGAMAFACVRQGVRPPDLGPGSTYLELGCGQGFGLNLLAAANPDMRFWGVDFLPGQIANAQRLARAAGLANVRFDDLSFEQVLALPDGALPRCDVIALHGVLSWISPEHRAQVVRILDRHLKPGGLVSVSYNALPGWSALAPLQRFVKAQFERLPGPPEVRAVEAFRRARDLIARDARAFGGSAQLKALVEEALAARPAYLLHEYLNDHFHPFYHADVARELDGARLSFAASSQLADDLPGLAAPEAMHGLIQGEGDPVWRETLTDFANNRRFRSDIFARGRNVLSPAEREARLNRTAFELIRSPEQVKFSFDIPLGALTGDPAIYGAVVEALAAGPRSYGDLMGLPVFAGADGLLMKVIGLLITADIVAPAAEPANEPAASRAFNRAVLDGLTFENAPTHLAAAATGSGARLGFTDLLALSATGAETTDSAATARRGWALMARSGARLMKDGATLTGQAEHEAELIRHVESFRASRLALYQRLGVV